MTEAAGVARVVLPVGVNAVESVNFADETLDTWNLPLSINLTGALLGLQTMLPLLRKGW
jgi:3alpha(or 20beta)-hydroxysteroid dehydrogenase